ncbi:MAG: hypothetical protein JO157_06990 [Acetobacteraceae bacterium]|nr:hypothetical protein [Acetobacteraceae bacterium]
MTEAAPTRARFDRVELAALGVFALLSLWVLALDLWQVIAHGQVWTGTDGVYIVDQLQYLAWIQSTAQHGLAANLFVLRDTPADYFMPAVTISGLLVKLGMPAWLSLLLWKPVALAATFFGFRAYIHASLPGRTARRAALVLALFFGSVSVLYGAVSIVGDLMPAFLSWGYTFGLIALGMMAIALVLYARARDQGRVTWVPGVLGAVGALLHPWQAEQLIVIVVLAEAVAWALTRRAPWRHERGWWTGLGTPLLTLAISGLGVLYYAILGKADLSWRLAQQASRHDLTLWPILLAIAPLVLPALLAWRPPRLTMMAIVNRVWLPAAIVISILSATAAGATPLHAFQGITLPLGILAVEGVGRLGQLRSGHWGRLPAVRLLRRPRRRYALGILAVAVLTLPGTIMLLFYAPPLVKPTPDNANFISKSERDALRYLAKDPQSGGVLTRSYLGAAVPGLTGRRTLIGDCLWSEPGCYTRTDNAEYLFDGTMKGAAARAFVRASGARFLLTDCETSAPLRSTLQSMVVDVHTFGCSSVIELDAPRPPTGPDA